VEEDDISRMWYIDPVTYWDFEVHSWHPTPLSVYRKHSAQHLKTNTTPKKQTICKNIPI
jgi:hypothetical protein